MNKRNPNQKDNHGIRGTRVEVRDGNINQAMRRLKRIMQSEGVFKELRDRCYYEKPSEKRKREKAAARKRHLKEKAQRQDR